MKSSSRLSAEADARILAAAAEIRKDPARLAAANLAAATAPPTVPRMRAGLTNRITKREPVRRFKKPANRR